MKNRLIIPTILSIAFWVNANGQHHIFRSYSMSDGLTNNAVRKIYQDSQGFIWICTWEGLNKFEGHKFTPFTTGNGLPHSMVNDILEVSSGLVMVALNDGTLCYIRNGRLTPTIRRSQYIINQLMYDPANGLLGVSDKFGLLKIGPKKITRTSGDDDFSNYEIIKWKDHFLTIGDPSPVIVYNNKLNMQARSRSASSFPHCIYKDRNDQILIGTERGLRSIDMSNPLDPIVKPPPAQFNHPLLEKSQVMAIYQDHADNWWFGTYSGLVKVSPSGVTRVFTEQDGLPGNRITCIMADAEKNIWVGTYSGLAKLPYQSLEVVAPANGVLYKSPLGAVFPIDHKQIIVIASDAVFHYNVEKDHFRSVLDIELGYAAVPVSGSDRLSVLYKDKLHVWDDRSQQMKPLNGFPFGHSFAAAQFKNMICVAHGGLTLRFGDGHMIRILDTIRMHTLAWDKKGRILGGAWNSGLYRITIDTAKRQVREIENFSAIPRLSHIRSIYIDREDNIWAGTRYNGITILSEKEKGDFSTRHINLSTGLLSDWVQYITDGPDGNIWVGSLAGISKVITTDRSYRTFNFSKAIDFYSSVRWLAPLGHDEFWVASDNGLIRFHDLRLENTAPLPVYFTDIRLSNTDSNYISNKPGKKPRLRYNENYLRFEFASPGFLNEKDQNFSYRLKGSRDTSWTLPSNQHSVEFASLSPGNYVFEVKMRGWNGNFGPVSRFAFAINRPFWQSWWFYLGSALLVIITALSIIRYRTQQLLKLQKVRNAIATDLHDDIGSSLTNISILSQLSLDSLKKEKETEKFISRIKDEVHSSNQALDDIIWSVNSHNDSLDETLARMRRYVGDLFDNSTTRYHLDLSNCGPDQKLHMEQRRDLFLIFKEALNNIHKHAGAGNVWIKVSLVQQQLIVAISDDGNGFDTTNQTHRNGIKNMRSRVQKWKGQFDVNAIPGAGTRIRIILPLAAN